MNARWIGVIVAAVLTAALAGPALAGHVAGTVTSYTGCLVSKDGVVIKIRAGDQPSSPCSGGQTQVHFGGGDITAITAGDGLQGGGITGSLTLSLAAGYALPQGCADDDIAKWNGTLWVCAQDANSTYTAGTGLDLTSAGEFSIEPGYRLPAAATAGDSVIRTSGGTWAPQRYATAGQGCSSGQFVEGVTSSGALDCAAPAGGGLTAAYTTTGLFREIGGTVDVLTLNLPQGSYLLFATLTIVNRDDDTASEITCVLGNTVLAVSVPSGENTERSNSFAGAVNHAGGNVSLRCTETAPDADIVQSAFHAVRVDSLN